MKKKLIISVMSAFALSGCVSYEDDPYCKAYNYMTFKELRESVQIQEPRAIKKAGKIYLYKELLLVNDINLGIHIIDNSDKNNPQSKAFLLVNGNVDIAVKDGFLYVDSFMDLVVFDINNIENIKIVKRVNDTFTFNEYQAINEEDRYRCNFDVSKGVVGVKP